MEKAPGGLVWLLLNPRALGKPSVLPPFTFASSPAVETQVALPASNGAGRTEKRRTGAAASHSLPEAARPCLPPALGCCSPASPPPSRQPRREGRSFLGSR